MDQHIGGFHSNRLELDEIWGFVRKKEGRLNDEEKLNPEIGDQYVFVAIDPETKLIPVFRVGKRDGYTAIKFIRDLHERLIGNSRIQLTTDGLRAYIDAVERVFGADIDFAQQVKFYSTVNPGPGRYSPPRVAEVVSTRITGNPDERFISTAHVESHNLVMRMGIRRLTRLTNAYSKKLANFKAALALYFMNYNFVKVHSTLKVTPAMEARVTDHIWTWMEILAT